MRHSLRHLWGDAPDGFTLLEVLVALVVLGFLMVSLTQGVQFGLAAWGARQRATGNFGDMDAVDRSLRGLVEHMYPGSYTDAPQLRGTAHAASFTTDLPFAGGAVDSRHADVELLVESGRRLVLRWTPHVHAVRLQAPPAPTQTELLRNVERLEISYLPRPRSRRGAAPVAPVWTSTWAEPVLPALIRIRLVTTSAYGKPWPDIVAAPLNERAEE